MTYSVQTQGKSHRLLFTNAEGINQTVTSFSSLDIAKLVRRLLVDEQRLGFSEFGLVKTAAVTANEPAWCRRAALKAFHDASGDEPTSHAERFGWNLGQATQDCPEPVRSAIAALIGKLYAGLDTVLVTAAYMSSSWKPYELTRVVVNCYLDSATDDEIRFLLGDLDGDSGAEFFMTDLLRAEIEEGLNGDVGFDDGQHLKVDEDQLRAWVRANRPELA